MGLDAVTVTFYTSAAFFPNADRADRTGPFGMLAIFDELVRTNSFSHRGRPSTPGTFALTPCPANASATTESAVWEVTKFIA